MRKLTGMDITMLVFGIIMMILTISLFGVSGKIASANPANVFNLMEFGIGAWYLLVAVLSICAGATGNKGCYTAVIVLSIIAIFVALAGVVIASISSFTNLFGSAISLGVRYGNSRSSSIFGRAGSNYYRSSSFSRSSSSNTYSSNSYNYDGNQITSDILATFTSLPYGVVVINGLTFIIMIVISCVACCGTCCNNNVPNQAGGTVIVTHSGQHVISGPGYAVQPPGYVGQPPGYAGQAQNPYGQANPGYVQQDFAMSSYKQ